MVTIVVHRSYLCGISKKGENLKNSYSQSLCAVYSNCCVAHRAMGGCKSPLLPSCSIVWGVPVNTPGLRMHHSSGFRAVPFSALTKRLSEGGKKSFASPLSPTLHGNRGSGAEAGSSYPSGGKRESSLQRCWVAQRDSIYRQGKAFQQHAEWLTV